jgi:anti-sigma B factor antagonist
MEKRMMGDVMVLRPSDERLDAANSGSVKNSFVDAVNEGQRAFVIDLSAVDFMDSTGLAALMSCLKSLGGEGRIVLSEPSDKVRKLFALTRLDRGVFEIYDTTDEALNVFKPQGD